MRNLKKLLAVIVTIAMIATFAIPAFASSTAPAATVADKDVKAAVERLSGLGIVNGMGDGKFHEELELTREDFTKMLVVALNLNNAATAAKGTTKFSDVASTRWSSGFVNVGVSKGIIKGYSNGKFGPADKLTEAQAITMLVRALGYKDAWLEGTWPDNMINRADEIGMLDDITLGGGIANRGTAALLLNNALDCELVKQSGFGTDATWEIDEGSSILADKLGYTEVEGTVTSVPAVDEDLDADEIVLTGNYDDDAALETKTVTVKQEGLDLNNLLLKDVTALANSDDEAVLVTVDTDAEDMVVGTITADDGATLTIKGANGEDDDYDYAALANGDVYDNYVAATDAAFAVGKYGTFILNDDGEVAFANIFDFDVDGVFVTEINAAKEYVKGTNAAGAEVKVDLGEQDGLKVFKGDAEVAFSDIKVNDVIYTVDVPFGEDTYTYAYIVTNSVTGTLKKVKADALTIDATAYDVSDDMTFSLNNGDDVAAFAASSDLSDAIGESVTAYLDLKGEARYVTCNVDETSDTVYGIAVKDQFLSSGDDAVKVYTKDDTSVTYTFNDDVADNINDGDILSFVLDKDGKIDETSAQAIAKANADIGGYNAADEVRVLEFDSDNDRIKVSSDDATNTAGDDRWLYVSDDTVFMNLDTDYTNADTVEPGVVTWADIKDKTVDAATHLAAYVDETDDEISFMVFTANYNLTSDAYSAYVTGDPYEDTDGVKVDVVLSDGTEASYVIANADDTSAAETSNISEGDFIVFETNADGEIGSVARAVYDDDANHAAANAVNNDYSVVAGKVVDFSNNIIKISTDGNDATIEATAKVVADTSVYVLTLDGGAYDSCELGDTSDIEEGGTVRAIINDGTLEMVVMVE